MIDIGTYSKSLTNDAIGQSILSVESSTQKAKFLAEHFDHRIKSSTRRLMEECSRTIHTPSVSMNILDHGARLSPKMHYLHHKLQSAMRAQSASAARQIIAQYIDEFNEDRGERSFINISSLGTTEWEMFSRQESTRLSSLEQSKIDTPTAISQSSLEAGKTHISEALTKIKIVDAELHSEILEHTSETKLFHSTVTQSYSDVRTMGAIFIRLPCVDINTSTYYFEQLIHEMSHLQLNCIFSIDRLILGDLARSAPSPLRTDPRPIFGVYHATYVSAKLCHALFRLYKHSKDDAVLHTLIQTADELLHGLDVLNRSPLTEAGITLTKSMASVATRVAYDRVWDDFDFQAPIRHRLTNANFMPNRLMKFRQIRNLA